MKISQVMPLVQCFHIYKIYGNGNAVLEDAEIQIDRGDFVFLTGHGGAGKTTLLKCILGIEPVSRGHILLEGHNLQRLPPRKLPSMRRRLGVVFQDFKLLEEHTVFENVALPLEVVGKPAEHIRKKVLKILQSVHLERKSRALCRHLSRGERQRVAVARAISNDPVLLLADEPTGNLDEEGSREIMTLFREVHARGSTVVITTHDQSLPLMVPECRTMVIHQGRISERSFRSPAVFPLSETRLH